MPAPPTPLIARQARLRAVLQRLARPELSIKEQVAAVRAAGRCDSALVLAPLANLARHRSWAVRASVAQALADLQRVSAVPLLLRLARDGDQRVAMAALVHLGRYPLPAVRRFLFAVAGRARRRRASARKPQSRPTSQPATTPTPRTRQEAAMLALARHGTQEARKALKALAKERRAARLALRRLRRCQGCGEPRYLLSLRLLLSKASARRRAQAVRVLQRLRRPKLVLPALLYAVDQPSAAVRLAAIRALVEDASARARKRLVGVALQRRRPVGRREALVAIAPHAKDPAARAALLSVLSRRDPHRDVALAALAPLPGQDISAATRGVLEEPNAPTRIRRRAARILIARRASGSAQSLWQVRGDPRVGALAKRLLKQHFPADYARYQASLPRATERSGLVPLMLLGGAFGTSGMVLLTEVAGGEYPAISGLSGAVLGGATAWLLNMRGEITPEQAATFGTFGAWGTVSGVVGGVAAQLEGKDLAWPVLGAQLAGVGAGMLLMRKARWTKGDLTYVNLTTTQALIAGGGVVLLIHRERDYSTAQRVGLGLLGGATPALALTASALTSKKVTITARDVGLITHGSLFGFIAGGLAASVAVDPASSQEVAGGLLLGEGLGYLGALAASQFVELDAPSQGWLWMSTYAPAAMGGGLGLLVPKLRGRAARGLTLAGASLGLAVGALTAKRLGLRSRDTLLGSFGTIYGGVLGGGLPFLLYDEPDGQSVAGGILLGSFGGMLSGYLTSRLADVRPRTVGIFTATTLASGAVGGGLSLMFPERNNRRLAALAGGLSVAGLAGGALAAEHLRFSEADHGLIALMTGWGATAGGFMPALWEGTTVRDRQRAGGALLGAGSAALATIAVSQAVELDGQDVGELAIWSGAGFGLGGGLAMLTQRGPRGSAAFVNGFGAATLAAGVLAAPRTRYSWRDALFSGHLAFGGLAHGAALANVWRTEPSTDERLGGAFAGASAGLLLGLALSQVSEAAPSDVGFAMLTMFAGDAMGAGFGLLRDQRDQDVLRLLAGAGMATWIAGGLWAPHTRFAGTDYSFVGFATGLGATLGAFTPIHLHKDSDEIKSKQVMGGLLLGAGGAFLASSLAAQHVDLAPGVVPEAMLFAADASLLGAGLGLMASEDNRVAVGLLQSMGIAGAIGGAFVAESTDYSGTDRLLATMTVGYGAWQGFGVALLADASDRQLAGAGMAVAALGGMVGAFLGQYLELSTAEVLTAFSGAVWGTTLGAFSANLARNRGVSLEGRKLAGLAMVAGNVGLGLSVLALSPALGMTGPRMGWINLFGLGGLALGTGVGAAFSGEAAQIGTIGGSVLGLATGVIVTGLMGIDEKERAQGGKPLFSWGRIGGGAASAGESGAGAEGGDPSSYTAVVADWAPLVQLQPAMDPASGEIREGEMQLLVGLRGLLN